MIVRVVTSDDRDRLFGAWEQVLAQFAPARARWLEWAWPTPIDGPPAQAAHDLGAIPGQRGVPRTVTVTVEPGPDAPWAYAAPGPAMAP